MKSAAFHLRPLSSHQVASEQRISVLSHAAKREAMLEWNGAYTWGCFSSIAAEQWEMWQCCPYVGPRSIHFYYVFTLSIICCNFLQTASFWQFPAGSSICSFVKDKRLQRERIKCRSWNGDSEIPCIKHKYVWGWVVNQNCEGCCRG